MDAVSITDKQVHEDYGVLLQAPKKIEKKQIITFIFIPKNAKNLGSRKHPHYKNAKNKFTTNKRSNSTLFIMNKFNLYETISYW